MKEEKKPKPNAVVSFGGQKFKAKIETAAINEGYTHAALDRVATALEKVGA